MAVALNGKSMFGAQVLSARTSAPAHGFGSSTRNGQVKLWQGPHHAKTQCFGTASPGAHYQSIGAIGPQRDSGKPDAPRWNFGTAKRFTGVAHLGAGPGERICSFS